MHVVRISFMIGDTIDTETKYSFDDDASAKEAVQLACHTLDTLAKPRQQYYQVLVHTTFGWRTRSADGGDQC